MIEKNRYTDSTGVEQVRYNLEANDKVTDRGVIVGDPVLVPVGARNNKYEGRYVDVKMDGSDAIITLSLTPAQWTSLMKRQTEAGTAIGQKFYCNAYPKNAPKWVGLNFPPMVAGTAKAPGIIAPGMPVVPKGPTNIMENADIKALMAYCAANKEALRTALVVPANDKPLTFIQWVTNPTSSGVTTKLDDGQIMSLYYDVCQVLK